MNTPRQAEFDRLVKDSTLCLTAYCSRFGFRGEEAKDLIQTALLKAWKHFDTFDLQTCPFGSWLAMILKRLCLDEMKTHNHRKPALPLLDIRGRSDSGIEGFPARDELNRAMRQLTKKDSVIIRLLAAGYLPMEIGEMQGVSRSAARHRVWRARKRMAAAMDQ